jgi:hypothetical protein
MSQSNALDRLVSKKKPVVSPRGDVVNESVSLDVKTARQQNGETSVSDGDNKDNSTHDSNLTRRGIEYDLSPWCRERGIPIMAYSPIEQGRILNNRTLKEIAREREATPARVAIAWLLHQEDVIVIPKSSRIKGVEDNRAALDLKLTPEELERLDTAFPAPTKPVPLEML